MIDMVAREGRKEGRKDKFMENSMKNNREKLSQRGNMDENYPEIDDHHVKKNYCSQPNFHDIYENLRGEQLKH